MTLAVVVWVKSQRRYFIVSDNDDGKQAAKRIVTITNREIKMEISCCCFHHFIKGYFTGSFIHVGIAPAINEREVEIKQKDIQYKSWWRTTNSIKPILTINQPSSSPVCLTSGRTASSPHLWLEALAKDILIIGYLYCCHGRLSWSHDVDGFYLLRHWMYFRSTPLFEAYKYTLYCIYIYI